MTCARESAAGFGWHSFVIRHSDFVIEKQGSVPCDKVLNAQHSPSW
jgi:hypothetical protein